jgi:hypothetical protein
VGPSAGPYRQRNNASGTGDEKGNVTSRAWRGTC